MTISIETLLLGAGFAASFFLAFNLGANDAATPTDTPVNAGALTIKQAIILFSIFTSLGAILEGFKVMKTIGKGVVLGEIDIIGAFAIVLAANIWILLCSYGGYEISVTHSIIGSVVGYGLIKYGVGGLNLSIIQNIIISWLTSPITAIIIAFLLYKALLLIMRYIEIDERIFRWLLIISLCFSAYSFGVNDIGNATGAYVTIAEKIGKVPDIQAMFILSIFGSIGVLLGGLILGPRVIETVAYKITRLNLAAGFAAELSNALVVYLFSVIPYMLIGYGIPISTSLASVGAIIGAGLARGGRKSLNKTTILQLSSFWILTLPITAMISAGTYFLIIQLLK
jgi:PiT family inorganic phosphate transporter